MKKRSVFDLLLCSNLNIELMKITQFQTSLVPHSFLKICPFLLRIILSSLSILLASFLIALSPLMYSTRKKKDYRSVH